MPAITCPLNNMKVAYIDSKYVDYIRNHPVVETWDIYDEVCDLEFDDDLVDNIREILWNNEKLNKAYPDEWDKTMYLDDVMLDFYFAYENQLKYEKDPTYDINPWEDEETNKELEILEENRIPVWVETPDDMVVLKYLDKRMLDGTLWNEQVSDK